MFVRLLIAVLMLAGPFPGRVCTCAAADACHPAPAEPVSDCPCKRAATAVEHHHAPPEPHDPDCPCIQHRPPASAVLTPAADLPADPPAGLFVPAADSVPDQTAPVVPFSARVGRYPVPLYLSLLSLRI